MQYFKIPEIIPNLIAGEDKFSVSNKSIDNINPHNGSIINKITRSQKDDVDFAVKNAKDFQKKWSEINPVKRGQILYDIIDLMIKYKNDIAEVVALETGKSMKSSLGETNGAIACARFFAGEGQRFFGRTMTSGVDNKYAMTIREPVGIAGLIIPSNTPIANVAWKVFPALVCGNSVVLKASEDAPLTSWIIGKIAYMTELPKGVFNIIQGLGNEAGVALVENIDVNLYSFTGSTAVGKYIAKTAGERLAKVSLELGGKNPLVVCDDADIDNAIKWILLSAFSNAGQRCASGSRIIIFESIYEKFKNMFVEETKTLKLGINDNDDLGPVINEKQMNNMLNSIEKAVEKGASILTGGKRAFDSDNKKGFYILPTIIENADINDEISQNELFGPITCLYKAKDFKEAIEIANNSNYGLTACIHTKNFNRAIEFSRKIQSGVCVVNGGTFGSEPHMPFGGIKNSGNGTREPGTEALDVYSNIKDIYQFVDVTKI